MTVIETPPETTVTRSLKGFPFTTGQSLFTESHRAAMYTYAHVENTYKVRALRVHMPIAKRVSSLTSADAADATSVALTVGAPLGQRVITVDAERVGAWPELPEPLDSYQDVGFRGVLLDADVTAYAPILAPDGVTFIYRVQAKYVYALSRPVRVGETPAMGKVPFALVPEGDQLLQTAKLFGTTTAHSLYGSGTI